MPKKSNHKKTIQQLSFYLSLALCLSHALGLSTLLWPLPTVNLTLAIAVALIIYPFLIPALQKNNWTNNSIYSGTALLLGASISVQSFPSLVSILLIAIIQVQGINNRNPLEWLKLNGCFLAGMAIASQLPPSTATELSNNIIAIGFAFSMVIQGLLYYRIIKDLKNHNQALKFDQKKLKLNAYKLSKYISPPIWKAIFSGKDVQQGTQRKKLTIFFSDIIGFSEVSEELEAEQLTELLNSYLTAMSKIVSDHGGTLDKFIGDGLMVFFGDPESKDIKQDCLACVSMALAMKQRMKQLQLEWINQGISKPLEIRMGINTGFCTVGNFGTAQRLDYTILGTEVNLASRLEASAPTGSILISHETYSLIKDTVMCRDKGSIKVKGFNQAIKSYEVANFRRELGKNQSYFEHRMEGFDMHLDLEKVKNYEKEQILLQLEDASERLRDKIIV